MSFERGQIVWVNFNPQKGHEQAGRRPAVVISPSAYNKVSNCILVCPITSNIAPWPWKVTLSSDNDGISGAILVDQIKSIDVKARNIQSAQQAIEDELMEDILALLATLTG